MKLKRCWFATVSQQDRETEQPATFNWPPSQSVLKGTSSLLKQPKNNRIGLKKRL